MLPALDALMAGDVSAGGRLIGARIPCDLLADPDVLTLGRDRLKADPAYVLWSPRAIILAEAATMIGHIGFHTSPDPEHLRAFATGAVEVGYTVFEPWRRQGFAREALGALMAWASAEHGVLNFIASVSPDNVASLAVVRGFQFQEVGAHLDEADGPETIFLRQVKPHPLAR